MLNLLSRHPVACRRQEHMISRHSAPALRAPQNDALLRIIQLIVLLVLLLPQPLMAAGETNPDKYSRETTNYFLSKARDKAPLARDIMHLLPAHQRQFVEDYVHVKQFKDDVLLKELIHPESRQCENDENVDYYDYLRHFYLHEELPEVFRLQIMEIDPKKQAALRQQLQFPVKPTHVMFIEYGEGQNIEGLQRYLREEANPTPRMYEVVKCPDVKTLRQFRAQMQ